MALAADAPPRELKLSVAVGPAFALGKAAQAWALAITERGDPTLAIRVFPGASLAQRDASREFLALREGAADLAVGSSLFWSLQVNELAVASLPWIAPTPRQLEALASGMIADRLTEALARAGAVALALAPLGHRELATVTDSVHAPADVEGLRVRTAASPLLTDFYVALGAKPGTMPGPAARDAFTAGALDAQEGAPLSFAAARLDAMGVRFVTVWGAVGELAVFAVNRATWKGLSDAQRTIIGDAAREAASRLGAMAQKESEDALESLRQRGVTITRLLAPAQARFAPVMQPMTGRWSAIVGEDLAAQAQAASRAAAP